MKSEHSKTLSEESYGPKSKNLLSFREALYSKQNPSKLGFITVPLLASTLCVSYRIIQKLCNNINMYVAFRIPG